MRGGHAVGKYGRHAAGGLGASQPASPLSAGPSCTCSGTLPPSMGSMAEWNGARRGAGPRIAAEQLARWRPSQAADWTILAAWGRNQQRSAMAGAASENDGAQLDNTEMAAMDHNTQMAVWDPLTMTLPTVSG